MSRTPQLTSAQYARIREVAETRQNLPSPRALAQELGVSLSTVRRWSGRLAYCKTYERERRSGRR